jgi:hypothetical protein
MGPTEAKEAGMAEITLEDDLDLILGSNPALEATPDELLAERGPFEDQRAMASTEPEEAEGGPDAEGDGDEEDDEGDDLDEDADA